MADCVEGSGEVDVQGIDVAIAGPGIFQGMNVTLKVPHCTVSCPETLLGITKNAKLFRVFGEDRGDKACP
jgi:hypothetical protein